MKFQLIPFLCFSGTRVHFINAFTNNAFHQLRVHKQRTIYPWKIRIPSHLASSSNFYSQSLTRGPKDDDDLNNTLAQIHGIIFDMDGTLIEPTIDFADMRRRIHAIADIDPYLKDAPLHVRRGDVLKISKQLSPNGQDQATSVFQDIEAKAIQDMKLMDGLGDLCEYLDAQGIQRAVLTRNVCQSIDVMEEKLLNEHSVKGFFPTVSRDTMDGEGKVLPSKPSPEPIHHICMIWQCSEKDVIMVGDSEADDIVAASRAGCGAKVLL